MNIFVVESEDNYGLVVHIVNAETKQKALEIAKANGSWADGIENVTKLDLSQSGVIWQGITTAC